MEWKAVHLHCICNVFPEWKDNAEVPRAAGASVQTPREHQVGVHCLPELLRSRPIAEALLQMDRAQHFGAHCKDQGILWPQRLKGLVKSFSKPFQCQFISMSACLKSCGRGGSSGASPEKEHLVGEASLLASCTEGTKKPATSPGNCAICQGSVSHLSQRERQKKDGKKNEK